MPAPGFPLFKGLKPFWWLLGLLGAWGSQNREVEQPACLNTLAAPGPGIQPPGARGPRGGGGPANPEPKTLNRPPEAKGYDLGLYFSYAKGGLGAGHPFAEY